MLTGTIINTLVILAGSLAGRFSSVLGEKGARLGERLQALMMQGIALCVLYIGISGSLKGQNALAAILSMALGAILGELLDLDGRMNRLGQWVQDRTARVLKAAGAPWRRASSPPPSSSAWAPCPSWGPWRTASPGTLTP